MLNVYNVEVHQTGRWKGRTRLPERICEFCKTTFRQRHSRHVGRFCSRGCFRSGNFKGARSHQWRGGRFDNGQGYIVTYHPGHPRAHHNGYVLEHRLVIEKVLGRFLDPAETVHHINGDRRDNRPENLQLRTGKHGHGVVHRCADCGSMNIVATELK